MPITHKPLNQWTLNKKVTHHNSVFWIIFFCLQNFKNGVKNALPHLKTQKMPITPKPLNQLTSNKKVTPYNFLFLIKKLFKISKKEQSWVNFLRPNHAHPNMTQLNIIQPNSSTTQGLHTVPCLRAIFHHISLLKALSTFFR